MLPCMPPDARADRAAAWERRTAAPLTALAVLFVVVYAVPILRPQLPAFWRSACLTADAVIWALLGVDYLVRLYLAADRRRFVRTNAFDLLVLILPVLRPLRVLRLVNAVLVLNRRTERWARGRLVAYVAVTTVLFVVVGGLAVLDAEHGAAEANIRSYPQALWWAVVTITTVGYGDHYPTTATGRLVALTLMLGGIGLIGFVTGSLATWIVERISTDPAREAEKADIAAVLAEVRALRAEVAQLRGVDGRPDRQEGHGATATTAG